MSNFKPAKISPARAARLKAKTVSITAQAAKLPATRDPKTGAVVGRKATKGEQTATKAPVSATKPATAETKGSKVETPKGNGQHPQTVAQLAADKPAEENKPKAAEELGPGETIELNLVHLRAAMAIAPKDDTRPYMNGVYIHASGEQLRLVATDGHRMIVTARQLEKKASWLEKGIILPTDALARIVKYIGKDETAGITVEFGANWVQAQIREKGGMATFAVNPLLDMKYPEYQKVLDAGAEVFVSAREEYQSSPVQSAYLKAAGAIAGVLGAVSIRPFVGSPEQPVVFTFDGDASCILYVMPFSESQAKELPAPTVQLYGKAAIEQTIVKLREQIEISKANAERTKHAKFRTQSLAKVERLQARIDNLKAAITPKLQGPAPTPAPAEVSTAKEVRVTH